MQHDDLTLVAVNYRIVWAVIQEDLPHLRASLLKAVGD